MYLNVSPSNDILPHTAIIVGWGPYIYTWDMDIINFNYHLFPTRQDAIANGITYPVPYVVDHGPQGMYNSSTSRF
jgi:hypothetical protein